MTATSERHKPSAISCLTLRSIHDLALASFARDDVRNNARRASGHGGRRPNGKGKAGTKHSHCWAYVQGLCHVQDCQYLHPVAVHLCESLARSTVYAYVAYVYPFPS